MTFYQGITVASTGSKQLIKNKQTKKKNKTHFNLYLKVYLVVAFVLVVTAFSMILK